MESLLLLVFALNGATWCAVFCWAFFSFPPGELRFVLAGVLADEQVLLLLLKRTSSENNCLVFGLRMFSMETIP